MFDRHFFSGLVHANQGNLREQNSRFCNGPLSVNPLSDRRVARLMLLSVVGTGPPHHAIREDPVSQSSCA